MKKLIYIFLLFSLTSCINTPNVLDAEQVSKAVPPHVKTNKVSDIKEDVEFVSENEIRIVIKKTDTCNISVKMEEGVPQQALLSIAITERAKCLYGNQKQQEHKRKNKTTDF